MTELSPEFSRIPEFDPVQVVKKQWSLVRESVGAIIEESGDVEGALNYLDENAKAFDIENLQRRTQDKLAGKPKDKRLQALLAIVTNMRICGEITEAMREDLPLTAPKVKREYLAQYYPNRFIEGLKKMDRVVKSLEGSFDVDSPIDQLPDRLASRLAS